MKPITILGLLMLLFAGCSQFDTIDDGNSAELIVKVNTSSMNSRGDAEKIDGQEIGNLSVYLIDKTGVVVAHKESTTANVTFGKEEFDLKRDNYTLMVVANNSNYSSVWKSADYNSLMGNTITSTGDYVSSKDVIQPLSCMKEITLQSGKNQISVDLERTFARFRIVVENNSHLPLDIKGLSFSDNFAQSKAYVFNDGTDKKYTDFNNTKGALKSTSHYAKTPFPSNEDGSMSSLQIESYTSKEVFDCYMLESRTTDDKPYVYTLDLEYDLPDENAKSRAQSRAGEIMTEIKTAEDLTDGVYILKNYSGYYLLENSGQIEGYYTASIDNIQGDKYMWEIVLLGNNTCYIKSKDTGMYVQDPLASPNMLALGNTPFVFNIETQSYNNSAYISFKGTERFIYVNGIWVYGYKWFNSYICFTAYKLANSEEPEIPEEPEDNKITHKAEIELTTLNPITHQSSKTREIKRNDFIDVHVTVNYNTVKGRIEYKVANWNEAGGDITFD